MSTQDRCVVCVCACKLHSSPLEAIFKSQKIRPIKRNNSTAISAIRNEKKAAPAGAA